MSIEVDERTIFECWSSINVPIHEITTVADKYRKRGDTRVLSYIVGELKELIEDLKTGRF